MKFLKQFVESAKEFKHIKSIVMAALLVALHTVLAFFVSFQVTPTLRISLSFLTNVMTGCLFGPVMGFLCGGVGDIIQFILKPVGPFFPGWTFNAALAGLIYGCFFYNKFPTKAFDVKFFVRCVLVLTFDTLLVNVFFGTLWTSIMFGKGFWFYFTSRAIKNLVQLPINIILTYYVLWFTKSLKKHLN